MIISLNANIFLIDYFYIKSGLLFLLFPTLAFLITFPKYISKFLKTVPYFFYLGLLQELTALHLGHWSFTGKNIINMVTIFEYKFPVEELFFWLMIFSFTVLTYFEFFDDEKLNKIKKVNK